MALFSFLRLSLVLQLIGLLWIALGTLKEVYGAGANVKIPGPYIKFVLLPPPKIIVPQSHESISLDCSASVKNEIVDTNIKYDFPFYSWLRNNEPLKQRKNEFQILNNGTLKIVPSDKTTGSYRCIANGTELDAGILISTETIVEIAVLKRISIPSSNLTATSDAPTLLMCPILSVPKANVSWFFDGESINITNNRFLHLRNGGLLIKNITGKFKCVAKNRFSSKTQRQFTWTVSVVEPSSKQIKTGLIPQRLQNETEYVEAGTTLKLHCVSYSEEIEWSYTTRSNNTFQIRNQTNELIIKNASVERHDGFYQCATKSDFQIINVVITTPPKIAPPLESWKSSLAAKVSLRCNVIGNPPPTVTWFRNGKELKNSYTVHYSPPMLRINSLDLEDEGIYQCFAKNIAGETVDSSLLILRRKDELASLPSRPENIECYPVNFGTVFVTFTRSPAISMITPTIVTENPFNWDTLLPIRLISKSNLTLNDVPKFKPFILFMRGMFPTSTQTSNGFISQQTLETSLRSEGVNCSTQGLTVNTIFFESGIFIWWNAIKNVTAKYFIIQFSTPIPFGDPIVGTIENIDFQRTTKDELRKMLFKIPLLDSTLVGDEKTRSTRSISRSVDSQLNFKPNQKPSFRSSDSEATEHDITEIRVSGNVTGLLIPNARKLRVRVLMITPENENRKENLKYVEWKMIEISTNDHDFLFRVVAVESRSIAVSWNRVKSITCMKTCFVTQLLRSSCQEIFDVGETFVITKLMPATHYRFIFMHCNTSQDFGMIEEQTHPDAPGPITNPKIIQRDGLTLSWDPPENPNGHIFYYNILWTVYNFTYNANVTQGVNSFQFPNITEDDKINITIRAVGSSGIGLPIYIDSKYISTNFEKEKYSSSDSTLGIIVGIILSILCIIVFIWIFIKQRSRFKSRAYNQNSTAGTEQQCPQTPSSNIEMREMQTLIPKSNGPHITSGSIEGLPRNGIYYCEPDDDTETTENLRDISQAICSSTPKITRKSDLSNDTLLNENSTTAVPVTATTIITDKNSSLPNFNSKLHSNGNSTKYQNGSIKTPLPPNKHSIAAAATVPSEPRLIKANGKLKIADSSQYSIDPNSNASILDNSRHKLLDAKLDSSMQNQLNDSKNHHHNHLNNCQNELNDDSNTTTTTTVDMDDSIQNFSCNPIKNSTWNYRRPIIDPNG